MHLLLSVYGTYVKPLLHVALPAYIFFFVQFASVTRTEPCAVLFSVLQPTCTRTGTVLYRAPCKGSSSAHNDCIYLQYTYADAHDMDVASFLS